MRDGGAQLGGTYAETWEEFVGQDMAKRQLRVAARSAALTGEQMPHTVMCSGAPGIGKTTLALLTAAELGTKLVAATGDLTDKKARVLLAGMQDGDVLFIDEIHRMVAGGKAKAEWLLNFLQDGVIMGPRGLEEMPRITVLAATTDLGRLPKPLLDRFRVVELTSYTDEQGASIAAMMARRIFVDPLPQPSEDNCQAVAVACNNNPRIIGKLLQIVKEICIVSCGENYDGESYDLAEALDWLGVSADGLTNGCQRYLLCLLEEFQGEPAGLRALTERLNEPGGLVHTEQILMDKGLVVMTKSGRQLTPAGIRRARELQR